MLQGKLASTNQKHYPDLGSGMSSVSNFCACFSDVISWGNRGGIMKCQLFSQAEIFRAVNNRWSLHYVFLKYTCHPIKSYLWSDMISRHWTPRQSSWSWGFADYFSLIMCVWEICCCVRPKSDHGYGLLLSKWNYLQPWMLTKTKEFASFLTLLFPIKNVVTSNFVK